MNKKQSGQEPKKFKYSVKEKKDKPEDSVILKEGYFKSKAEFSINAIKEEIRRLRKGKLALSAEKDIKDNIVRNVLDHYPELKKMKEKLQVAVFLKIEGEKSSELKGKEIEILNEALDNYAKELDEIQKQTKIKVCLEEDKK